MSGVGMGCPLSDSDLPLSADARPDTAKPLANLDRRSDGSFTRTLAQQDERRRTLPRPDNHRSRTRTARQPRGHDHPKPCRERFDLQRHTPWSGLGRRC